MLKGHQFQIAEIEPVIAAASRVADKNYFQYLDYSETPELARWRRALGATAALRVELRSRYNQFAEQPESYRESSPLWQQADQVLADFADIPEIVSLVAQLPVDPEAGQRNVSKLAVAGGLVAAGIGLWLWGKGKL